MNEPTSKLGGAERPGRGLDLDALRTGVWRQRRTFFSFLGAVLVAALVGTLLSARQYKAVALIQLMPRAGQEVDVNEVVKNDDAGYLEGRDRARTQIQIILSRGVREEVVRGYQALGYDDFDSTTEGLEALRRAMTAAPREDTQLVEIGVLHADPARATVLANLVADEYCKSNLRARTDAARETQVWLDGQTGAYRATLVEASMKVMAFKEANNLVDADEKVDGISTRMAALQAALGAATTERVLLEGKLKEHKRLMARGEFAILAGMFDDPALQTMSKEHATIATDAAQVLSRYGDRHPEHQRVAEHLARVEVLIAEEVKRNVDAERSLLQTLVRQEGNIGVELDQVKAELLEKQHLLGEYVELKLDEDRARRLYGSLGERGAEVDLQAHSQLNDVRVLDRALPPSHPATPNIPLNMAMALAVGLAGGFALALLRHRLDDTLLSTADIEYHLDTPLIGVIPSLPPPGPRDDASLAGRALYSFDHPRTMHAEALRSIRAVIQSYPLVGSSRRLLVTSCLEDEGKTHAAIGLAVAFAQTGASVLLIDADLRLPKLHTLLDVPVSPGLTDLLVDIDDGERIAQRTKIPRLHLLPSGTRSEYPNELLSSPQLESLLGRLGQAYQVVIIDSPPAGVVSDALALAGGADGVILIVRHGRVPSSLAIRTLGQLRQMGARVMGVALNDVPRGKDAAAYGSRYYDDSGRADGSAAS
ncbi:MAG: polysaccharide biosynthesis tyrosine autokinase [Pseudomonadota bacterium]|nr:polysaccharide biosynthesis tyrosine autokinase [Pseudomonadota bacterium]